MKSPDNIKVHIDSKDIAYVFDILIDKISKGIGYFVTKETPQKQAIEWYIETIKQNDNIPAIAKAAMISEAKKTIKGYINQKDILGMSVAYLEKDARPQDVGDDFISKFFDEAKHVYESDIKDLWAKVLASECNLPGSVPKKLISILAQIDKSERDAFKRLCNITGSIMGMKVPLVLLTHQTIPFYHDLGLDFQVLNDLQNLGLIHFVEDDVVIKCKELIINYSNKKFKVKLTKKEKNLGSVDKIPIGSVQFTRCGLTLFNLTPRTDSFDLTEVLKYYYVSKQNWWTLEF